METVWVSPPSPDCSVWIQSVAVGSRAGLSHSPEPFRVVPGAFRMKFGDRPEGREHIAL